MEEFFAAAIVLSGVALGNLWLFAIGAVILIVLAWQSYLLWHRKTLHVTRSKENPILSPIAEHQWESEAVFNPAAIYHDGRVHLLYRALGNDGISRIGYASSADGIHFDERLPYPVFVAQLPPMPKKFRNPFAPIEKRYHPDLYASGGGWGGSEDPRAVKIDDRIYMTFGMFESWESMRIGLTSIDADDVSRQLWKWAPHIFLSPQNETHKNWVLFPEKINGKFAILHALTPEILIDYVDTLEELEKKPIRSNNHRGGRAGAWDAFVRGAGAPPIKTPRGWLLFYHGMNPEEDRIGYKVGAMLLDLNDPTHILYRSSKPVLVPSEWYENDWKAGVVYASGAVVKPARPDDSGHSGGDGTLFLYYGGGDKTVSVATAPLNRFLDELTLGEHAVLKKAG